MVERREGNPEGPQQLNPYEKAVTRFENLTAAPTYRGDALKRTLDSIKKAGTKHMSPGTLYASLADLSGRAAELAAKHGNEADQQSFAEQQVGFQRVSEVLAPAGQAAQPTTPSSPRRTTGRASG